jgi:uncharacterized protein
MGINAIYHGPADCPDSIPIFPLSGALLLPRGQIPLTIFEPRYMAMIDDALKTHRIIGMVQPDPEQAAHNMLPRLFPVGCAGRITQLAETGDGRYIITLTGIARYKILEELPTTTLYRQCQVDYSPFLMDFQARAGEDDVNRAGVIKALRDFVQVNDIKVDWKGIQEAPNEALVNALCMMCPFGVREKQALLEALDLKTRADVLIAITEIELARGGNGPDTTLQ